MLTRREILAGLAGAAATNVLAPCAFGSGGSAKTVWGIAELFVWLYERGITTGHDTADCLQVHLDQGIRHVMWSVGRSVVEYHSDLPTSTLYAGDSRPETKVIGESFQKECSLRAALEFAAAHEMVIYGRLAMNRHYGSNYGGGLRSKFCADHPEWLDIRRNGRVEPTRLSFGVPEYRAERIGILTEVAKLGAHGLCLDFCRQPPLVGYHPSVLDPWMKEGNADPRSLEVGSRDFLQWAQHRCDFVTQFLRDLRAELRDIEAAAGRRVPVLARITEATFDLNLMEGIDIQTWVNEGLVDEVALDPFVLWQFDYPESALPYVDLCRKKGVRIHGGANTVAAHETIPNARSILERVKRNYDEGVDGMALYQTDRGLDSARYQAIFGPLVSRLADPVAVNERLVEARKATREYDVRHRWFGVDNHSRLGAFGLWKDALVIEDHI